MPEVPVMLKRLRGTGRSAARTKCDLQKLRPAADRLVLRDYPSLATIVTEQRRALAKNPSIDDRVLCGSDR